MRTTFAFAMLLGCAGGGFAEEARYEVLVAKPLQSLPFFGPVGQSLECALDGGPLLPFEGTLQAPASGEHWVALVGKDAEGNPSAVRWIRLRVDDQPPEVKLQLEPQPLMVRGRAWMNVGDKVLARASDAGAGVARLTLSVNERTQTTSTEEAGLPLESVGTANIRVAALDALGHAAEERTMSLSVDDGPPSLGYRFEPEALERDGRLAIQAAAQLTLSIDEGGAGLAEWNVVLDGIEWTLNQPQLSAKIDSPESNEFQGIGRAVIVANREVQRSVFVGTLWGPGRHTLSMRGVDRLSQARTIGPIEFWVIP